MELGDNMAPPKTRKKFSLGDSDDEEEQEEQEEGQRVGETPRQLDLHVATTVLSQRTTLVTEEEEDLLDRIYRKLIGEILEDLRAQS